MSRLKSSISTILIVAVGLVGLAMILYPTVADWYNDMHQTQMIAAYDKAVSQMDTTEHDKIFADAERYNAQLAESGVLWHMDDEQMQTYESLLDVTGTGIMGYIEIPKINVTLPIYHGTDEAVLKIAVGHLAGTSLPVGGKGTHCSVSGHRGLPDARLFTDVDALDEGDRFSVTTLDRMLTYEVDQIRTVLPTELDELVIWPDKDYFTLVTCTPYGVNTHRLLIRGHRVQGEAGDVAILADALVLEPRFVALWLLIPLLVSLVLWVYVLASRSSARQRIAREVKDDLRSRR